MKSKYHPLSRAAVVLGSCVLIASCGDDPEMVRKREEQRAEISKLQGELSILQEKMEQIPPDRSVEIAELKQQSEENRGQIATLEREIDELSKQKSEIERQHQAYRRKYVAE